MNGCTVESRHVWCPADVNVDVDDKMKGRKSPSSLCRQGLTRFKDWGCSSEMESFISGGTSDKESSCNADVKRHVQSSQVGSDPWEKCSPLWWLSAGKFYGQKSHDTQSRSQKVRHNWAPWNGSILTVLCKANLCMFKEKLIPEWMHFDLCLNAVSPIHKRKRMGTS